MLLLLACASADLKSSLEDCSNYDFSGDQVSTLESTATGSKAVVWRTYVERDNTDDAFAPDIVDEGTVVNLYEVWEAGSDGTPFCFEPTLTLSNLSGQVEVRWFLSPDDSVPFDTVRVSGQ